MHVKHENTLNLFFWVREMKVFNMLYLLLCVMQLNLLRSSHNILRMEFFQSSSNTSAETVATILKPANLTSYSRMASTAICGTFNLTAERTWKLVQLDKFFEVGDSIQNSYN